MQLLKPLIALTLIAGALGHNLKPSKVHPNPPKPTPTCATGTHMLCCNEAQFANSNFVGLLLGLLNVHVAKPKQTLCGVTCSNLSKPKTCQHKALCCKKNDYHGVVAVDCAPLY